MIKNNWEEFFDKQAPHYMKNGFTKNTVNEVDFLIEELQLTPGQSILDIGCGTGRHSVELARRGFQVTGIDISSGMLNEAQKAAKLAKVNVEWIQADAVTFQAQHSYDAVICLCEGAFGLIGREEDPIERDTAILLNIAEALKSEGRFILTTINAYWKIRSLKQDQLDLGHYNPITMIEHYTDEWELPGGKIEVEVKERTYFPFELKRMFSEAGFNIHHIWNGMAGHWNRKPIQLDEIEIMIVANKIHS